MVSSVIPANLHCCFAHSEMAMCYGPEEQFSVTDIIHEVPERYKEEIRVSSGVFRQLFTGCKLSNVTAQAVDT